MNENEIKPILDDLTQGFVNFKQRHDERLDALAGEHAGLRDRIEELEARSKSPGLTAPLRVEREHSELFSRWLRRPNDATVKTRLAEFESKAVSIGTDAAGGFAVPEEISREIERLELKLSPVRRLVRVLRVGTSDHKLILNLRGTTSGWVGETDTRSETLTSQLREIVPTHGELYAYPQATEWSLDDMFFNVGEWLAQEVAQEFALEEGEAVVRGNGTNKPTGMLNTAPVATADFASPLRAAAAYQFVESDTALSPPAPGILADSLINLVYTVNASYRADASWAMNSTTAGTVRKLKDADGQYLWQPGLAGGQPDRLLGYPIEIWEQLDDVGANKFPVLFGNFRRGYVLTQRTQIRITTDANITTPGRIKFFVRRREGGMPWNNDAIKFLKTV